MILEPCQSRLIPSSGGRRMHAAILASASARLLPILAVALLLGAAVPTQAQTAPVGGVPPLALLEDAVGDVRFGPTAQPLQQGTIDTFDLHGLAVSEDETSMTFAVTVASLPQRVPDVGAINPEGRGFLEVTFSHGENRFLVRFCQCSEFGTYYYTSLLRWSEALGDHQFVRGGLATLDWEANTIAWSATKADLADEGGAAPFVSRVLRGVTMASIYEPVYDVPLGEVDRMPDSGEGVDYPIRAGLRQSGDLGLWSEQPFRSSNGEATTFVYTVEAENRGRAATFLLEAMEAPPGWEVTLPEESVEIASGETKPVVVLATVPFAHEHGTQPSFVLRLTDPDDPERLGQIRLGVSYSDPPHPSGHHPDLYFTSGRNPGMIGEAYQQVDIPGYAYARMGTTEPAAEDASVAVPGYAYQQQGSLAVRYSWWVGWYAPVPIGLDFDLGAPVRISVPIATDAPLTGAYLEAHLYAGWRTPDGGWGNVRLVSLASPKEDLLAREERVYQLEGLPTPEADLVEPRKDMYLSWNVFLYGQRPLATVADAGPVEAPVLLPGGSTHLPLLEYHDPVQEVFASLDGVRLDTLGPDSRAVNPGETVLFNLTLANEAEAGRFHLALRGEHAPWARILGSDTVELATGEERRLAVAVTAPADAPDGQPIDLLVEAHGPGGATALLRLGGEVVTGVDLADESALVPGLDGSGRDSPAPGLALLALAVLAAAAALRRRRT